MAFARSKEFYDLIGKGLNEFGYSNFGAYLDDMFAEKYNANRTFEQLGFPLNPSIPINPTFQQLEVTVRPYTMATHTDIDSDGPTKSTDGVTLKMGQLPVFKHEITIGRKELREQMAIAERVGNVTSDVIDVAMEKLFVTTDSLLGGNYNTVTYNRHQTVSNYGKLVINSTNSHLGIPLELDFGIPSKNKVTSAWYTKNDAGVVTQKANINPVQDLKNIVRNSKQRDFAPAGHFEVSQTTWDDIMQLDAIRIGYSVAKQPAVNATNAERKTWASFASDADVKAWLESVIGAPIVIIDHVGFIEKFDTAKKKMAFVDCPSFVEGVFVYLPNGAIGDAQFGRPIYMETPGSRSALYDGGRTLIRQVFNDETMTQVIKSEFSGLCIPNATRWMYYLTVKG